MSRWSRFQSSVPATSSTRATTACASLVPHDSPARKRPRPPGTPCDRNRWHRKTLQSSLGKSRSGRFFCLLGDFVFKSLCHTAPPSLLWGQVFTLPSTMSLIRLPIGVSVSRRPAIALIRRLTPVYPMPHVSANVFSTNPATLLTKACMNRPPSCRCRSDGWSNL